MPNYRDNHLAARALVDALLTNDRKAAAKHKITDRTLRNYRAALETDNELSALFNTMRTAALTLSWADELNHGLHEVIAQIRTRSSELPRNAEGYQQLVDAARALGEIAVAREVLGATGREDGTFAASGDQAHAARLGPN